MLPCWDEPALKATFDISVKHSQKYGVLSNMPIREQFLEQDGMLRTNFHTTPLMSTYIVAIAMSEFVRVPNANETINMWCKSSLTSKVTFSHSVAEKVVEFLIEYTNSSQKVPKMDHILIPNFVVGGMENWGLITYRESGIIYDNSDPIYQKTEAALVVAHELAHQWFGNLVTPSWWPYLWLSEGFASFFESYTIDKIFKDWRRMDLFVIQTMQQCFLKDTGLLNSVTLKIGNTLDEKSLFSTEVYKKAPVLLRMLHNTITAEVFRKGLITYLATHQFSTATPDDLWSAMQSALDESDVPHEGYRIKEVMDTWMNQERYPFVHVERNYETGEVTISQSCVRQHGETEMKTTKWWIPITFATQSNLDFSNTVPRYWLRPDQHNISFIINPNDWIIVNLQLTGYYRVSYDTTNWYIRFEQLFDRLFRYVGYVEDPNDDHITKLTRLYALQMACFFGHEECKKMSALKLSEYLANHEIHKIPSFMYCTGMMTASRTTWDKMLELYLNKEIHLKEQDYDKRLLWGLSCAENPNIVKDYLNMAARNTSLFPNTDHSFIFNFIIRKPLTIPAVLKLILQNVYVNEQVDKIQTFSTNFNLPSNTSSIVQKLIEQRKELLKKATDDAIKQFYYTTQ
ncbi:PREDICTED: aminopeptidase N [Cyphomyrmex costatus]|uniref:aminopeptidase N n=1 Tax=Cyphomyrmex costatus TaxID=456900 RepID=UPI0008523573|nr:PREDICTED: aminopeptidase N [Cyphomyrmex costatus]